MLSRMKAALAVALALVLVGPDDARANDGVFGGSGASLAPLESTPIRMVREDILGMLYRTLEVRPGASLPTPMIVRSVGGRLGYSPDPFRTLTFVTPSGKAASFVPVRE